MPDINKITKNIPLWNPSAEQIQSSNMTKYMNFVNKIYDFQFKDYNELYDFKKEVEQYKHYLIGMSNDEILKNGSNTDLLNIRDEILGHLNQFTYLLTFK